MLKIEQGSLKFKKRTVLENINLTFEPGHIYTLIGPNGSGKTLILKVLAGFITLNNGQVSYKNKSLGRNFLPSTGIIIEKHKYLNYLTGYENMKLLADINKKATDSDIEKYMTYFGLGAKSKDKVTTYSLGMTQKLSLVQAFMESPDVLLLDEPTNALDEEHIGKFKQLLLEQKKENKIIIMATHDKTVFDDISDFTISIREGLVYEMSRQVL